MSKKFYLDYAWDISQAEILINTLSHLKNKKKIEKFLADLLTVKELKEISRRLLIAKLLFEGKTYKEIQKELRVNPITINRVNLKIKHGRGGYKLIKNFL
jgi:TrpR-related protein YerC/YecD